MLSARNSDIVCEDIKLIWKTIISTILTIYLSLLVPG